VDVAIENLTKRFGSVRANDGITLRFAGGRIHGVLGENGAGKSTLMKVLSGYTRRDAGVIALDGAPVRLDTPADALKAGIGMVHQDPLDVPAFTTLENFICGSDRASLGGWSAARRRLVELNERLGFSVPPQAPVGRLTVGQRQQLEIMRLLAAGARLLILDEPTTGISAAQSAALFTALRRLAAEGNTVLFVSHKLDEVADICDTVTVLRAGRVQGAGQLEMPQPQEQLLRLMFGAALDPQITTAPAPVSPADAPPVWRLEDVTVRDGNLTLRRLSLQIAPGMALGLAGLEGSGQQQLLRLLCGQLQPGVGRVLLAGANMTGASVARFRAAGVEYLPADRMADGVIGSFSLAEHLELLQPPSLLRAVPAAEQAAAEAIAAYDIKATPTMPLAALSGGNQQRAMLALAPEQSLGMLLDQPTRGLDVASASAVWRRLAARRAAGTAIVFASADLDELLANSDAIMVFFGGRVSAPIPRTELNAARLAELIGGVGFEAAYG
jgi:simple sugar transport system ATP-binding protein